MAAEMPAGSGSAAGSPLRVTQVITTLARGGAQATVLASAAMADHGVSVRVLVGPDDTDEGSWWGDPAIADVDLTVVPDLVRSIRPGSDVRALRWLIRHLRADRPDVVHTHSSKAGVLGRLAALAAGVPCVHTVHGWGPMAASRGLGRSGVVHVERALARVTAALVVVGRPDREAGLADHIGRPEQYRLIRSGIEFDAATVGDEARSRTRADLGIEPERLVIGMVGRMSAQKDQATLIRAFDRARLAGATLVLVGDGPTRAGLERLVAELTAGRRADRVGGPPGSGRPAGDVRFLGARPDGAALAAGFDVAVNASRWEGLPRTVVEAAVAGVPVIASDVGATSELIESGRSGWLVRPGDPEALANAIVEVTTERPLARTLAAEARRRSEVFSADRMRDDLARLWREVAMGSTTGADPARVVERDAGGGGRPRR